MELKLDYNVMVEISERSLSDNQKRWQQLQPVIGAWKGDGELETIFAQIDRERHADRGREVDWETKE
ncbi:hypothetical protein [Merismopedia glauca]|uniref:hypothetical protein n=1 Tax=Merismopedia glauca TaxID=292586 RepID=UPI0011B23F68|nr:hypothetical protein [Merismopedia glauca]